MIAFYFHTAWAENIKTASPSSLKEVLEKANQTTLVIFDVDDVLLHPSDQILQKPNKPYLKEMQAALERRISKDEAYALYSIILQERQTVPVDPTMVNLLKDLQSRGVKTLVLTNCSTGQFGSIPAIENWRIQELMRVGYNFSSSWKGLKSKRFDQLLKYKISSKGFFQESTAAPLFKEGVIFASNVPKGKVLKAFLAYAQFKPDKIIFVDDKQKNLDSVEEIAIEGGIPFEGFKYTAVSETSEAPLNIERAQLQFHILETEKKWISDEEVTVPLKTAA
jgi:FMN phosphatase YigB (HAD superfamily)